MSKFGTEFFFARRLSSGDSGRSNNVMVKIASISVAIGIAVMIVALAVIFGFKREISDKMAGFMSHVQIRHYDRNNTFETVPISANQPFLNAVSRVDGFRHISRYALKPGILKGEEYFEGILLKGVGPDYDWSFFGKNLVAGKLPVVSDSVRYKEVLISQGLASEMKLTEGDSFEVMFIQDSRRRDVFRVAGIYNTDLADVDNIMVIADIRDVQRLNGWDYDRITGFEIMSADFDRIEEFSDEVLRVLYSFYNDIEDQLMVVNLRDNNPVMFDWLETHDLNAAIIITIMLLVSVFNMIAAMLIILLEKTSFIGILKALGMTDGGIRNVFVIRSSYIILKGMLWGNVAGLLICFIQKYTGLVKLSAEGYFLSEVPIFIDWRYIVALNVGVFVVIILFQLLPTMIISKIKPEKSIRFE